MFSFSYERLDQVDMGIELLTENLGYNCVCGEHDSHGGRQYEVGSKYASLVDAYTQGHYIDGYTGHLGNDAGSHGLRQDKYDSIGRCGESYTWGQNEHAEQLGGEVYRSSLPSGLEQQGQDGYCNSYILRENTRYKLREELEYICDRIDIDGYDACYKGHHKDGYIPVDLEAYLQNYDVGQSYDNGVDYSKLLDALKEYGVSEKEISASGGGGGACCCCSACSTKHGSTYRTTYGDHYGAGATASQSDKPAKKLKDRNIYDIG